MVNCDAYYRCKTIIHIFIVTRLEKKECDFLDLDKLECIVTL